MTAAAIDTDGPPTTRQMELARHRQRWELVGEEVASIHSDGRTRETCVQIGDRVLVVRGTRALRCPDPMPVGDRAVITDATRVTTDEAAILTIHLRSGDVVQVAGSGIHVR